ncbi:MAG: SH3 domain-containing protein [Leptospiraceae bacterium]
MIRNALLMAAAIMLSLTVSCETEDSAITLYGGAPSGLVIRSEPTTTGEKLGLLEFGEPAEVVEQKEESLTIQGKTGKWTKIRQGSVEGWVFGGFLLANPPEQKKGQKDLPTVTSLQSGDVGCYVELTYPDGKTETWLGYFDVCEESILNKKIKFTIKKGQVMADSCMGDPECPDTEEADLISTVTVVE